MRKFEVAITETLRKTVTVKAKSLAEAEELVESQWNNSEHVLDAEDFVSARFDAKVVSREQER